MWRLDRRGLPSGLTPWPTKFGVVSAAESQVFCLCRRSRYGSLGGTPSSSPRESPLPIHRNYATPLSSLNNASITSNSNNNQHRFSISNNNGTSANSHHNRHYYNTGTNSIWPLPTGSVATKTANVVPTTPNSASGYGQAYGGQSSNSMVMASVQTPTTIPPPPPPYPGRPTPPASPMTGQQSEHRQWRSKLSNIKNSLMGTPRFHRRKASCKSGWDWDLNRACKVPFFSWRLRF